MLAKPAGIVGAVIVLAGAVRLMEVYFHRPFEPAAASSHYQEGLDPHGYDSPPLRAVAYRRPHVGLEVTHRVPDLGLAHLQQGGQGSSAGGWPVFEEAPGSRLAPSMEERAEDHPAEGQRMRITDHSPIQHMAAEQGPRDLERRYAIQQQGEAAGTARAGSFGAQPAVGDSEARDPVVAAGFVVADGDPNKKYTNHASSIVQVGTGEFLAAWFAGTDENAPDVAIWTARYQTGDGWGPAVETVAPFSRDSSICAKHFDPPVPCKWQNSTWNPVLMRLPDDELLLFYKTGPHPSEWTGWLMRSKDKGHTWGAPAQLPLPVNGPAKHKPIMLPSGVILAGASTESGRTSVRRLWQCWIDYSEDRGYTWKRHGPIPFDGNIIQPSLWIGDDMSVHLLARTATDYDTKGNRADPEKNKKEIIYRGAQYLIHAQSDTTGLYWPRPGKPVLDLPSPNAAGDVVRLSNGRLLVIYNHSKERKALGRSTLLLSMSRDGGSSWQVVLQLEDGPPNDTTQEYSYPSIIQADDGLVHLTYTYRRRNIRHVVVDPQALRPLKGKFGKEYSGKRGHYDTSVLSSSMHHMEQSQSGSPKGGKKGSFKSISH
eukprot:jgi/Tetstr1/444230/TSEL_032123.t1